MFAFDARVSRSDPAGLLVRFEAEADAPVARLELDLEGDDEPAIPVTFPTGAGFDGRYVRALAFKPTRNGTWPLVLRATTVAGATGATRCTPGVTVTF